MLRAALRVTASASGQWPAAGLGFGAVVDGLALSRQQSRAAAGVTVAASKNGKTDETVRVSSGDGAAAGSGTGGGRGGGGAGAGGGGRDFRWEDAFKGMMGLSTAFFAYSVLRDLRPDEDEAAKDDRTTARHQGGMGRRRRGRGGDGQCRCQKDNIPRPDLIDILSISAPLSPVAGRDELVGHALG